MAVIFERCPACGSDFLRSEKIIPGRVVLRCPKCERYSLERDNRWVSGPDVIADLKARAEALDRDGPEARYKAMWDSDDDDPRWRRP